MTEEMGINLKIVLVGDVAVGKTCLIHRLIDDIFYPDCLPTLGFEISLKSLEVDGHTIIFTIWDLGGQQCFDPMRENYYRDSRGFLVVYNLANRVTFRNVDFWVPDVQKTCPGVPILLVGNKSDLEDRKITPEEMGQKAEDLQVDGSVITSAKTSENVLEVFETLGRLILDKIKENQLGFADLDAAEFNS